MAKGGCTSSFLSLLAIFIGSICLFTVMTKGTLKLPCQPDNCLIRWFTNSFNSAYLTKNNPLLNKKELSNVIHKSSNIVRVWFIHPSKQAPSLIAVNRNFLPDNSLNLVIKELLDGPSDQELKQGLASEIPKGTILLGIKNNKDNVVIDLSQRFVSGGGTSSMELRLEQLKRTVSEIAGDKDVFLNIEGKRLVMTPGEGLEVKQPINR